VGRRNLIRALAALSAVVLLAAAGSSAAAVRVHWSPLAAGTTTPSGAQFATGYLAVTRAAERPFVPRLDARSQRALAGVSTQRDAVAAVFLDGAPCATKVAVTSVTRSAATLTVHLAFTRPPVGMATCVRTSTPYLLLTIPRASLGRPVPTHVSVDAVPRP
jgi:hypothetical protein